jgi:AcrR family transcriptional regulator
MSDFKSTEKRAKAGRLPVQERSAARMSKVLEAAVRMLEEVGPEKTSIPALSEVTGVPRAAIYPFFPDKYALFSHLAKMYMEGLSKALATSKAARARSWKAWVDAAIKATAQFYNAHPAASTLLLRGAFSDTAAAAHSAKNLSIGRLFRAKAASLSALRTLPTEPDVTTIAVEIAFACMKHGYAQEGRVSNAICQEASRAVMAYLSVWDEHRQEHG